MDPRHCLASLFGLRALCAGWVEGGGGLCGCGRAAVVLRLCVCGVMRHACGCASAGHAGPPSWACGLRRAGCARCASAAGGSPSGARGCTLVRSGAGVSTGAAAHAGVARSSGSLLLRFCDWRERHPGAAARSSGSASVERCPSGQRWRQPLFQHHGQFSPILGQDQLFQKPAPGRNKATAAPEKPSPNILG